MLCPLVRITVISRPQDPARSADALAVPSSFHWRALTMDPLTGGLLVGGASLLGNIFNTTQNNANAQSMQQTAIAANQAAAQSANNFTGQMQNQAEQFNAGQTSQQEAFQQNMVQQQEAYNTNMSNTAYQRTVADMKAAGINPMTLAGSGLDSSPTASAPSGASASVGGGSGAMYHTSPASKTSALGSVGPAIQGAVSTALDMKRTDASIDNLQADTINKIKTAPKIEQETLKTADEAAESVSRKVLNNTESENVRLRNAIEKPNADAASSWWGSLMGKAGYAGNKLSEATSPISNLVSSARGAMNIGGYGYH